METMELNFLFTILKKNFFRVQKTNQKTKKKGLVSNTVSKEKIEIKENKNTNLPYS